MQYQLATDGKTDLPAIASQYSACVACHADALQKNSV